MAPHLNWAAQTSHKKTSSETRSQEYNYIKGSQFSAPGIDDARCFVEVKEAFVRSWTYTSCKVDGTCHSFIKGPEGRTRLATFEWLAKHFDPGAVVFIKGVHGAVTSVAELVAGLSGS